MSSDDALCNEILVTLRQIFQAIGSQSRQLEQAIGLTGPQLRILQAMASGGSSTVGELATRVSLSQGTVTSILDRLARKQLIHRERGRLDRRKVHVSLTATGRQLLQLPTARSQAQFADAFGGLPDTEKHQMLAVLQRLAALMSASDPEADKPSRGHRGDPSKEQIYVWNHRRHSS